MDEEMGLMIVNDDTTSVAAHFFLYDQLARIEYHDG